MSLFKIYSKNLIVVFGKSSHKKLQISSANSLKFTKTATYL